MPLYQTIFHNLYTQCAAILKEERIENMFTRIFSKFRIHLSYQSPLWNIVYQTMANRIQISGEVGSEESPFSFLVALEVGNLSCILYGLYLYYSSPTGQPPEEPCKSLASSSTTLSGPHYCLSSTVPEQTWANVHTSGRPHSLLINVPVSKRRSQ